MGQLATKTLQKAAVACQKVIAQVSAKVVADKFKALDACANAALACVQTKQDDQKCLAKAGKTCAKQLNKADRGAHQGAGEDRNRKELRVESCASRTC